LIIGFDYIFNNSEAKSDNAGFLMDYEVIAFLSLGILAFLGVVGGIPQIFSWVKAKPSLKITKATISKLPNDNYKYQIHLEIENEAKTLRKNGDASNVTAEYFIINKNSVQWASVSNQIVIPYLLAGTKILKDLDAFHSLTPSEGPYTIVFRVTSNERRDVKRKITYDGISNAAT
jgi:hypothetical protein